VPGTVGGGGITAYMGMAACRAGRSHRGGRNDGDLSSVHGDLAGCGSPGPMPAYHEVHGGDAGRRAEDLGGAVALYMATMPDAGLPMRYSAPQPKQDAGLGPMPLYMAPMPTKN